MQPSCLLTWIKSAWLSLLATFRLLLSFLRFNVFGVDALRCEIPTKLRNQQGKEVDTWSATLHPRWGCGHPFSLLHVNFLHWLRSLRQRGRSGWLVWRSPPHTPILRVMFSWTAITSAEGLRGGTSVSDIFYSSCGFSWQRGRQPAVQNCAR